MDDVSLLNITLEKDNNIISQFCSGWESAKSQKTFRPMYNYHGGDGGL